MASDYSVGMEIRDYRAAVLRAREHFKRFPGIYRVLLFEAEAVSFDEEKGVWVVVCSFLPGYGATWRVYYEATVSTEGSILRVRRLK
ncbi:MAG: hypothetical protein ACE5Z5_09030 [Candidatus Bathyarchaeia archaeon]